MATNPHFFSHSHFAQMVFFLPFSPAELKELVRLELARWADKVGIAHNFMVCCVKRNSLPHYLSPLIARLLPFDMSPSPGQGAAQH